MAFSNNIRPALKLVGEDGNAFLIIVRARVAAQKAGVSQDEIERFAKDAQSGDYPHVIEVVSEYFEVV
jgi:hypothetical protein